MSFAKKALLLLFAAVVCYAMLNYHFLFYGGKVKLLKKSGMNFEYTFFNITGKRPESVLSVDALRHDGIGRVLVELGLMSEDRMLELAAKYDAQ